MYTACYILAGLLSIWGGCLVARVIANRLEHGLFRRRSRKGGAAGTDSAWTPPVKRSGWWSWVWIVVLSGAVIAGTLTAQAESQATWSGWSGRGGSVELWAALAFATLGLSGGLAIVGLRFDPSRGRRRCPRCWYDMSATTGRLCPECGHEAPDERHLFVTRRSRATIALAMALVLSVPLGTRARGMVRYGWIGAVPTTLLIPLWRLSPRVFGGNPVPGAPLQGVVPRPGGLVDRLGQGELWRWQRAWLASACEGVLDSARDPRDLYEAAQVSQFSQQLLENEGPSESPAPLVRRAPIILERLGDPDSSVSGAAAALLPLIAEAVAQHPDSPGASEARAKLLDIACGNDARAGPMASQGIGWFRFSPDELDRIATSLRSTAISAGQRRWLVSILARVDGGLQGRLARLLADADEEVRALSHEAAGPWLGAGPLRRVIVSAVESDSTRVAGAAAHGLSQLWNQSSQERDAILARARRDAASAGAMVPALDFLLSRGRLVGADMDSVLPALLDALGSPNSSEVEAALSCLARLDASLLDRNDRTRQELSRIADDGRRPMSQRDAARATLGRLPPRAR